MIDTFVFTQLNGLVLRWIWFDYIVIFFAIYVPWILAGVLLLFLIKDFKKYFKPAFGAFLSAVLGGVIVLAINAVFYRVRPFVAGDVNLLFQHLSNSSFPSFHTTALFAASFFLYTKKLQNTGMWRSVGCVFLGISFLVALSRIIAGVHWPTDILAGIVLGGLCGWVVCKIFSHSYASD